MVVIGERLSEKGFEEYVTSQGSIRGEGGSYPLELRSANLFANGHVVNILGFAVTWSLLQLLNSAVGVGKGPETVCKRMRMAVI